MRNLVTAAFLAVFSIGVASQPLLADEKAKEAKGEKAKDKAPAMGASATKDKPAAAAAGEVTLKGQMMCAKCALKESDKCQNVLKVSEGGKETAYLIAKNDVAKKAHSKVCGGAAGATVKGTVGEEGGKKLLTASEIKYE